MVAGWPSAPSDMPTPLPHRPTPPAARTDGDGLGADPYRHRTAGAAAGPRHGHDVRGVGESEACSDSPRRRPCPPPTTPSPGAPSRCRASPTTHEVLGTPLHGPWPEGTQVLYVAMGCFWGAERIFWKLPGVVTTAAGYMGGFTPNPTYEEVCSGRTGHTEAVLRRLRPGRHLRRDRCSRRSGRTTTRPRASARATTSARQYRSAIYWTTPEQEQAARATRAAFQEVLHGHGFGEITTELRPARGGRRRSTTPRTTTSSTSTRTPAATATTAPTG